MMLSALRERGKPIQGSIAVTAATISSFVIFAFLQPMA